MHATNGNWYYYRDILKVTKVVLYFEPHTVTCAFCCVYIPTESIGSSYTPWHMLVGIILLESRILKKLNVSNDIQPEWIPDAQQGFNARFRLVSSNYR